MIKLKYWDKSTSLLHLGLAITVTAQLLTSQLMSRNVANAFLFHEIFGLAAVCVVFLHWLWNYSHKQNLRHLFPWNRTGLLAVAKDVKAIANRKLPPGGDRQGLAGLIHGLGFLAVTGMALSGLYIFITLQFGLHPEWIQHVHSFIANFVWVYWFGHVALAIIHFFTDRVTSK